MRKCPRSNCHGFQCWLATCEQFQPVVDRGRGDPLLVSWTGTLASGESVDVPFCEGEACLALADGLHDAAVQLTLTSAADENVLNDSFTTAFETNGGVDVTWTIFDRQLPRRNHLDGFRRVWCHGVVWRSLRLLRDFVFRDGLPVDRLLHLDRQRQLRRRHLLWIWAGQL